MATNQKAAVLYHYPCPDGAFAALAAHFYHSAVGKPVVFYPNRAYNPISVVILDHHKTTMERLLANEYDQANVTKVIDMNKSGATISYDFFDEKILLENTRSIRDATVEDLLKTPSLVPEKDLERISLLFKYVEDADLWRWALPDSKAFSSGMKDIQIEFSFTLNPGLFEQLRVLDPRDVIDKGRESLSQKQKLIDEALEQAYEIRLGNGQFGNCLATNADTISNLRSELGHQLASKSLDIQLRAIGAVVYNVQELNNNDILKISLRSVGSEDTTRISQAYGGGGHQNASSFMISRVEFEKWKV